MKAEEESFGKFLSSPS